jgi:hypothetical protein
MCLETETISVFSTSLLAGMALIFELERGIRASPVGLDAAVHDGAVITQGIAGRFWLRDFPVRPMGFDNVVPDVRRSGAWHRQRKGIP